MQHYFKLIGQPVYFGYNNGRTIKVETDPCRITFLGRTFSMDYQLFSAGSNQYEPIGAEAFSQKLIEVNALIQAEVQTQLSLSIIKS
jgi:hypothetical protein